ncbi:MAG TPA: ABC transporter permease [Candidatus Sulfotelmatobacter sp.]|nr:ABC transporter permease [Candidatus Sulfotelmatobacter sp.]
MTGPSGHRLRIFTPKPPLTIGGSVREIWAFRELVWQLASREVRVRYKQTVLGVVWAVLQPLSMMAIFTLVFGRLARLPSDGLPYPLFYFTALVPWAYFSGGLSAASNSLTNEAGLLTKIYFPRAVIPLAALMAASLDFAIAASLLALMLAFYGIVPQPVWGLLPVLVGIQVAFTLGIGLLLAAANVTYRDVRYAIPLLLQLWLYATPIVYPLSLIPVRLRPGYVLVNPMAVLMDGYRSVLLRAASPDPLLLVLGGVMAAVVCVASFAYFRRAEWRFADIV